MKLETPTELIERLTDALRVSNQVMRDLRLELNISQESAKATVNYLDTYQKYVNDQERITANQLERYRATIVRLEQECDSCRDTNHHEADYLKELDGQLDPNS